MNLPHMDNPAKWNEPCNLGPGKYEGERWFTLHYHDATFDSGQDEAYGSTDEGGWYGVFILKPDDAYDAAILRDDPDAYSVCIMETSDGFVTGTVQTKADYDGLVASFVEDSADSEEVTES